MRDGTICLVEGAALLEVREALSCHGPDDCHLWALQGCLEATASLILCPNIRISPAPDQAGATSGPYGEFVNRLAGITGHAKISAEQRRAALDPTRRWARRNSGRLESALNEMKAEDYYLGWAEWLRRHQWEFHTQRHGGLFEESFLPEISGVLHVDRDELETVWDSTRDLREVKRLAALDVGDADLELVQDAFTISTLLRGRYYEQLSKRNEFQLLHHPMRSVIADAKPAASAKLELPISNVAWHLSTIVVAGAFKSRPGRREAAWMTGVEASRGLIAKELIDVRNKETDTAALSVAVDAARRAGIDTHSPTMDTVLAAATAIGLGALTSFALSGFDSLAVTLAGGATLQRAGMPRKITRTWTAREKRLRDMAELPAGRIQPRWSPDA